jgi:hypothetical protein
MLLLEYMSDQIPTQQQILRGYSNDELSKLLGKEGLTSEMKVALRKEVERRDKRRAKYGKR